MADNDSEYRSRLKTLKKEKTLSEHANNLEMQSSSLETASENIRQQKEEWEKALVARAKALDTLREDLVLREKAVAEREDFSEKMKRTRASRLKKNGIA